MQIVVVGRVETSMHMYLKIRFILRPAPPHTRISLVACTMYVTDCEATYGVGRLWAFPAKKEAFFTGCVRWDTNGIEVDLQAKQQNRPETARGSTRARARARTHTKRGQQITHETID